MQDEAASPFAQLSHLSQERDGAFSRASAVFAIASFPAPAHADSADEGRLGPFVIARRPALPAWMNAPSASTPFPALDAALFRGLLVTSTDSVLAGALLHQRLVFGDTPAELSVSNSAKRWRKARALALTSATATASDPGSVADVAAALLERACEDNSLNSILTAVLVLCHHAAAEITPRSLTAQFIDAAASPLPAPAVVELVLKRLASAASAYAAVRGETAPHVCVCAVPLTALQLYALVRRLKGRRWRTR